MVSVSSFGLRYLAMMAVPNPKESSLWGTCVYEAEAAFRSTEKLKWITFETADECRLIGSTLITFFKW